MDTEQGHHAGLAASLSKGYQIWLAIEPKLKELLGEKS